MKRSTKLKVGDKVVVISGGNGTTRKNVGATGVIKQFVGADRVVVEGVNVVSRHKKRTAATDSGEIVRVEAPVHISNVMFYVDSLSKGVRLSYQVSDAGEKVRGYRGESGDFVQVS